MRLIITKDSSGDALLIWSGSEDVRLNEHGHWCGDPSDIPVITNVRTVFALTNRYLPPGEKVTIGVVTIED